MKLGGLASIGDRLPPLMKQRLPLLLIAVVVMSLTGVMIRSYIAEREREIERRYRQKFQAFVSEPGTVVQAMQDIPPDSVLKPGMFEEVQIPVMYRQPYAATSVGELIGKRTTTRIAKGEQVMQTKLETLGTGATLAGKTPAGHRALTLGRDQFSSIPEALRPSDRIDVMWTFPIPQQGGGTQPVTATLFQHVLVLGVGATGVGSSEEGGAPRAGTNLTLALTPQESELMFFAQALGGRLHLILRPHTDKEIVNIPPTSTETLLRLLLPAGQAPSQPAAPAPRNVEIFRGLKKEVITFPPQPDQPSQAVVAAPEPP